MHGGDGPAMKGASRVRCPGYRSLLTPLRSGDGTCMALDGTRAGELTARGRLDWRGIGVSVWSSGLSSRLEWRGVRADTCVASSDVRARHAAEKHATNLCCVASSILWPMAALKHVWIQTENRDNHERWCLSVSNVMGDQVRFPTSISLAVGGENLSKSWSGFAFCHDFLNLETLLKIVSSGT